MCFRAVQAIGQHMAVAANVFKHAVTHFGMRQPGERASDPFDYLNPRQLGDGFPGLDWQRYVCEVPDEVLAFLGPQHYRNGRGQIVRVLAGAPVLASTPIRTNLNSPKRRDGCPGLREVAFAD